MSRTIPLKKVLKFTGDTGTGHMIGLSAYPIPASWTPEDRIALNTKIIQHYYNRDIGMETVSLFTFALARKMNEVMPYWVQVYDSARIEFDPLATYDLETVRNGNAREVGNTNSNSDSNSTVQAGGRAINSDFPQTFLNGDSDYATSGTDNNSATTSETKTQAGGSSDSTTTQDDSSRTKGFQGSAADLLTKYRATLLNIDMLVLGDLEECFLGTWGVTDLSPELDYGMFPMLTRRGLF